MARYNILICDDHPIFLEGLRFVLSGEASVFIAGEASNGRECLEQAALLNPDIILLDIHMPEMSGLDCLKVLRRTNHEVKVLAITQYDEPRLVNQMMKNGANGYLLKHSPLSELKKAFQAVMAGKVYCSKEVEMQLLGISPEKKPDGLFPNLSEREREIIRLISNEHPTKQIATLLGISIKTVEVHRSNIFKKLNVTSVAGVVKWAVNNGLWS